jgi:hypothetical protein
MNILYFSVDRNKYQIQIPLPPKIDPSVTMMTVEEKPDVTYNDVGGCKEQIEKMREVTILLESLTFCSYILMVQVLQCYGSAKKMANIYKALLQWHCSIKIYLSCIYVPQFNENLPFELLSFLLVL